MRRGFERARDVDVALPKRATSGSAGYDFHLPEGVALDPGHVKVVPSGVRAVIPEGETLLIFPRSSLAIRRGVGYPNPVAVIDSDYNREILLCLSNPGSKRIELEKGDRVAQGVFVPFLVADDDSADAERTGGVGSTGA